MRVYACVESGSDKTHMRRPTRNSNPRPNHFRITPLYYINQLITMNFERNLLEGKEFITFFKEPNIKIYQLQKITNHYKGGFPLRDFFRAKQKACLYSFV